jgi:hypothetical protein
VVVDAAEGGVPFAPLPFAPDGVVGSAQLQNLVPAYHRVVGTEPGPQPLFESRWAWLFHMYFYATRYAAGGSLVQNRQYAAVLH